MAEVKELQRRAQKAEERLTQMKGILEDTYRYACPDRNSFSTKSQGEAKWSQIFDTSLADAVERLANELMMGLTPPSGDWFEIIAGPVIPSDQRENVDKNLRAISDIIRDEIAASNFYTEIHKVYLELCISTGVLSVNPSPDNEGLLFESWPVAECGLEPGANGTVGGVFRKWELLNRVLPDEFPGIKLPDDIMSLVHGQPDACSEVQTGIYKYPKSDKWKQCSWIKDTIVFEQDFDEAPVAVPRASVFPGEVYGRGPAMKMRPDAHSLSECRKLMLAGGSVAVMGMWSVDHGGLVNPENTFMTPGGFVFVDSNDSANPTIRPLETATNFNWGEFNIQDLRSGIRRGMYVDDLANVEGPKMTATEIMQRQNMVAKDMGALFGRIQHELIRPVLNRVFAILQKQGKINAAVPLKSKLIDIRFVSPLNKTKQLEEANNMRQWIADLMPMAQIDQGIMAAIDTYQVAAILANRMNIPGKVLRSEEETKEIAVKMAESIAKTAATEQPQ